MKKQVILIAVLTGFAANLNSQGNLPTDDSFKNKVFAAPLPAFLDDKTIQLGYERKVSKNESFEWELGWRYDNTKTVIPTFRNDLLVSQTTRGCYNGVYFVFFLPIPIIERCRSWSDTHHEEVEEYDYANLFLSSSYRFYFARLNRKSNLPNGLYLAPGLTLGRRSFIRYTYREGEKANNIILDDDFKLEINNWGIPFLADFIGRARVIDESIYSWSERIREDKSKTYLRLHFQMGAAFLIAKRFSLDLGGHVFLRKNATIAPVVKAGIWF